jgi:transposase
MVQAIGSGIPELKSFVVGIERDYDAVHAALRLPWSQGTTEGKVNKLKTLKRVMYGRAGFALLRQRLLHDA